jgi:glycosyltransferase involved in cell wall biosynthesis
MRKISLCIPYYNRSDMVMETLAYPLQDDRIDEIILCDDVSPDADYYRLISNVDGLPKIRVVRNVVNHHNQHNKRNCISFSKNDWCITIDNDNVLDKTFVDKLYEFKEWDTKTIYHPAFASPNFDYRMFNGDTITSKNVNNYTDKNIFVTLMNTNNYLVNRDEYLNIYHHLPECRGADGIYNNHNWLKAGNKIHIVKDLQYFHRVHPQSEFLRESSTNMKLLYYWLDQVKQLK